jgi:uncharacterized protein YjbJ (UPF0337 family)
MSTEDKASNKKQDIKGKVQETVGNATGDDELKGKGKGNQVASDVKQAGEKVKDALKH